ncbi:hypothetical protein [Sinomonas albida]|uniref:hypothetical protein n=1 Tax=Sinomonas albida TaxID=369942 RepID=UPI003015DF4E
MEPREVIKVEPGRVRRSLTRSSWEVSELVDILTPLRADSTAFSLEVKFNNRRSLKLDHPKRLEDIDRPGAIIGLTLISGYSDGSVLVAKIIRNRLQGYVEYDLPEEPTWGQARERASASAEEGRLFIEAWTKKRSSLQRDLRSAGYYFIQLLGLFSTVISLSSVVWFCWGLLFEWPEIDAIYHAQPKPPTYPLWQENIVAATAVALFLISAGWVYSYASWAPRSQSIVGRGFSSRIRAVRRSRMQKTEDWLKQTWKDHVAKVITGVIAGLVVAVIAFFLNLRK